MIFNVYIPGHWGISSKELTRLYKTLSPNCHGKWGNIQISNNLNECEYVLISDQSDEDIPLNKKVIFFGREPYIIGRYNYTKTNLHLSFHHEQGQTWLPQTWWLNLSYDQLIELKAEHINKNKFISAIDSGKVLTPNHKLRVDTIYKLNTICQSKFDIYGYICNKMNGNNIKGTLPHRSKESGLLNYKFNLCIENCNTDYYFSEKFIDPLLCWTMPVYFGCNKISNFFPKGSYYAINPSNKDYINEINDLINSDYYEKNIPNIKKARDLILNQYNLLPTLHRALNTKKIL